MSATTPVAQETPAPAPALDRDRFLRWLVRDVAGTLEDVVGLEEAKGYLSLVAEQMGTRLDEHYEGVHGGGPWTTELVGEVLCDLKQRIGGNFRVVDQDESRLVFENTQCPFGDAVVGRPSLCMMTSNVFGRIGSNHLGHVTVELAETIASGSHRCVVNVTANPDVAVHIDTQRHYFADTLHEQRPPTV